MKVKDLIKELNKIEDKEREFLVASDEELNVLFKDLKLEDLDTGELCIYGLNGYQID